ncbi:STAS-like domain-containing protein [Vibrio parahaemolyticus]|uniref:STAS-like domain-containing protein n=1 Tax=Vibrio parahaemolyticus TaxID=670 RepID=UPI0006847CBD|nr:STAS-like domain-containing protein [Vibrio parahaemolyticus]ELB2122329.1 STAS-like domain-containing protein [Vibrio parahaemolyticus]MBE4066514.1 STAS-like domain-containing protein [Vibrio parahaemolyticus]MDF4504759.1 STAS-like domain-containing protein [Vibrio parahaemolyticus]MDG3429612.1 STAS-like domain-containing protein [Vibrio parahaemolyticus]OUD66716.1 hypothetical protein BTN34_25095 [Vibrio parahaemolyticus]
MEIIVREHFKFGFVRYRNDGPHSGEAFREDVLEPALKNNTVITIDLNNDFGFPSSWLEECFGGLVRNGFKSNDLLKRINILCDDSLIVEEIVQYIKEAV